MSQPKPEERPTIAGVITTAIAVAGFALLFLTQRQSLSLVEQIFFGSVIALSFLGLIIWVWFGPISRYWTEKQWARDEDRISREGLPTFESFVERLKTMCSIQRMDALVFPLQNLKSQAEFSKLPDLYPWLYYVESLCSQLLRLFQRVEVNRETFPWAVDSFTFSLRLFSDSVNRFVTEARLMAEQKTIPKSQKEEYNTNRQTYLRFLEDYTTFVEKLNKQFRTYEKSYSPGVGGSYTVTAFQSVYAEKPKEL